MSSPSPPASAYPPYHRHSQTFDRNPQSIDRNSQSFDRNSQPFDPTATFNPNPPPAPPPKPTSRQVSRGGTPAAGPPLPPPVVRPYSPAWPEPSPAAQQARLHDPPPIPFPDDPGAHWLPQGLQDHTKHDLADILVKPPVLAAWAHAPATAHPSIAAAQEPLQAALAENIALATHLEELEGRLGHLRAATQTQLLSTYALERQWRQKQTDMDRALAPYSPSALYQRLHQGVQEQEMVCRALEESFLDADGATAPERETTEWIRRYRDAKKLYYSRRERKERWDEGRVGGWR